MFLTHKNGLLPMDNWVVPSKEAPSRAGQLQPLLTKGQVHGLPPRPPPAPQHVQGQGRSLLASSAWGTPTGPMSCSAWTARAQAHLVTKPLMDKGRGVPTQSSFDPRASVTPTLTSVRIQKQPSQ